MHAGHVNRRLFNYVHDPEPVPPASALVTAALRRLRQSHGSPDAPVGGKWAVVVVDSLRLHNSYYLGQIVRILAPPIEGRVPLDWGSHWKIDPFVAVDEFHAHFRLFDAPAGTDALTLMRYTQRDPSVPEKARLAMWMYAPNKMCKERVGHRVADYNCLITARQWDNFEARNSADPLGDRLLFALGPIRNLQEARHSAGIAHVAPDNRGWYRMKTVRDALDAAMGAARHAYPRELISAAVFTASELESHMEEDDDSDQDETEHQLMRAQLSESTNLGGVFPVSIAGTLSQVRLGRIKTKDHLDKGDLQAGGWTFSIAGPNAAGDKLKLLAIHGQWSVKRKDAEDCVAARWKPLHSHRDVITRNMQETPALRMARFTMMGTRAHAKCFFRTLRRVGAGAEPDRDTFIAMHSASQQPTPVLDGAGSVPDARHFGFMDVHVAQYSSDNSEVDTGVTRLLDAWTDTPRTRQIVRDNIEMFRCILPEWLYGLWDSQQWEPSRWEWVKRAWEHTSSKFYVSPVNLVIPGASRVHRRELSALYEPPVPGVGQPVPCFCLGADDKLLEEDYADNARHTLLAFIRKQWKQLCRLPAGTPKLHRVMDLAAEYPIYWPYGTHSRKAGSTSTRPYETRADGVVQIQVSDDAGNFGDNPEGPVLLVEFKMRMEVSSAAGDDDRATANFAQLVTMRGTSDRRQAELNSWMLYLDTGILPTHALVIQATRRRNRQQTEHDFVHLGPAERDAWRDRMQAHLQDGAQHWQVGGADGDSPFGYIACLTLDWASPYMQELITRFATRPYGKKTSAFYADTKLLVPDLDELARMGKNPWDVLTGSEFKERMHSAARVADELCRGIAPPAVAAAPKPTVTVPSEAFKPLPSPLIVANPSTPLGSMLMWPLRPTSDSRRAVAMALKGTLINSLEPLYAATKAKWAHRSDWAGAHQVYLEAVDMAPGLAKLMASDAPGMLELTGRQYMPLLFSCKHDAAGKMTEGSVVCYYGSADTQLGLSDGHVDELGKLVHSGAPVFRPEELDTLQFYKLQKSETETARTQALRTALYQETLAAATRIMAKLTAEFPLKMRDIRLDEFWYLTVNKVYRRNLTADGPLVHEFDLYPEDGSPPEQPYNDPPRGLSIPRAACPPGPWTASDAAAHTKELKRVTDKENKVPLRTRGERAAVRKKGMHEALVRCMNRLVNSRLLRGALALAGCDVVAERDLVDEGDDENDIAQWMDGEEAKARESEGDPDDETEGWWRGVVDTSRRDWRGVRERHARLAVFPHRSQRAAWTEEALATAAEGQGCVVEVAERHLLADMRNAIARRA